jgi:hypothetical protein
MPKVHIRNNTDGRRSVVDAAGRNHTLEPGHDARLELATGTNLLGFEVLGGADKGPKALKDMKVVELQEYITTNGGTFETDANKAALLNQAEEIEAKLLAAKLAAE